MLLSLFSFVCLSVCLSVVRWLAWRCADCSFLAADPQALFSSVCVRSTNLQLRSGAHRVDVCCSIICVTGRSVHGEVDREVRVTVVDSSRTTAPFSIRGSTLSSHASFSYKVCKHTEPVYSVYDISVKWRLHYYPQRAYREAAVIREVFKNVYLSKICIV